MDGWMDGIASIASMLAMGDRRARAGVPSTAFSVGAGSRVKGWKGLKGGKWGEGGELMGCTKVCTEVKYICMVWYGMYGMDVC